MKKYYKRLTERILTRKLEAEGGVIIEGPRFVGKSTMALQLAKSDIRLDESEEILEIARLTPKSILRGATPRLIDEWQLAPNIWNVLRHEIDQRQEVGQFILTGSATPTDDVTRHSGAGRIGRVRLRTMSLYESNNSEKIVNFKNLFDREAQKDLSGYGGLTIEDYCEQIVRGGWPSLINMPIDQAIEAVDDYVDNVTRLNLADDENETDPNRMRGLIQAISRNIATEASKEKITREAGIATTVTSTKYIDRLSRVFVLENLPAWRTHIRSTIQMRVKPKWHFVDPSIAVSSLGLSPNRLLNDLPATGFFFESLAIRDLRIYASMIGGEVFYYRDSSGLEVDAIVQLRDGRWSAFEIKLGGKDRIVEGVGNLRRMFNRLTDKKQADMMSLNVITGGNVSMHNAEKDVNVISLGHLWV
ncbi:MAG: DUF4143 domain-containing protein [Clostridiales Family XIII bacterium]|jgi:predicted AAA+ superfamily ATPase|nr:DUF4143 domain-containing protein [Clostridiales Family XIII bacterium]